MSTSGEVYQTLYEAVDEYAETARLASTATVDQVVGAAALARSQGDVAAARAELSERFGMPRDRARLAIDAADGVLTSAGRSVIERVCALRLSRDAVSVITSLTDRGATAVLPRKSIIVHATELSVGTVRPPVGVIAPLAVFQVGSPGPMRTRFGPPPAE